MKYYIVIEDYIENYEGYENITLSLYSAESKESLFKFMHCGRDYDYKIQESDIPSPCRDHYKTEVAWKQACRAFKFDLEDKIREVQRVWDYMVNLYKTTTFELQIPCEETEIKKIQSFNIV